MPVANNDNQENTLTDTATDADSTFTEAEALDIRKQMVQNAASLKGQALKHFTEVLGLSEVEALHDIALQGLYKCILFSHMLDDATKAAIADVPLIIEPGVVGHDL